MEANNQFKRKRNRVKYFDYSGTFAYFITICTYGKEEYFNNTELIDIILINLKTEAERCNFSIYAYCFMPDHLHLLLIGDEESSLVEFIKLFKQKTGYYFKGRFGKPLWQKSFYDHVLRKRESINDIAGYIFENPIRKKLVDDFRKYPYLGSFVIDINEFYEIYDQRGNLDVGSILGKR